MSEARHHRDNKILPNIEETSFPSNSNKVEVHLRAPIMSNTNSHLDHRSHDVSEEGGVEGDLSKRRHNDLPKRPQYPPLGTADSFSGNFPAAHLAQFA